MAKRPEPSASTEMHRESARSERLVVSLLKSGIGAGAPAISGAGSSGGAISAGAISGGAITGGAISGGNGGSVASEDAARSSGRRARKGRPVGPSASACKRVHVCFVVLLGVLGCSGRSWYPRLLL